MKYLKASNEYRSMIESVANHLWREKEKMDGIVISWEDFTTDWVKDVLPKRDSKEDFQYTGCRSNRWVSDINSSFRKHQYPCKLFVMRDKGVRLYINGEAASAMASNRTKQFTRAGTRTILELTEAAPAYSPRINKQLKSMAAAFESGLIHFVGVVRTDPILSKQQKDEYEKIVAKAITKCLPLQNGTE